MKPDSKSTRDFRLAGQMGYSRKTADVELTMSVMLAMAPKRSWSQLEIGDIVGLTESAICYLEKRALRKMLRKLEREGWCRMSEAHLGSRHENLHVEYRGADETLKSK